MQAVELLNSLPLERAEIESKLKQARRVISFKNAAEYEDRLIRQNEAGQEKQDLMKLLNQEQSLHLQTQRQLMPAREEKNKDKWWKKYLP